MVNFALFEGSFLNNNNNNNIVKNGIEKKSYMLLPKHLTLLQLNNYEDYLVMDVVFNELCGDKKKSSVTNEQYEDLKHAFIAFDLNADGFICSEDLGHVMKRLGHDLSVKETKKIFKEICTHDNGKLDFPDFVEMMAQDKLVLTTSEQELLAAFQFLDQNNDGYITVDELINKFHGCLSDSEASRLMSEADANGDGRIDFEEFKHMMFNNECGISLAQPTIEHYS